MAAVVPTFTFTPTGTWQKFEIPLATLAIPEKPSFEVMLWGNDSEF